MRTSSLIIAASVITSGLTLGSVLGGTANASPLVQPKSQIAKIASAENIQLIGNRSTEGFTPRGGSRPGMPEVSGYIPNPNIPGSSQNGGGSGWTSIPNPNAPGYNGGNGGNGNNGGYNGHVHRKWHYRFHVHGGRRNWCHKHYYKVRGMHFHSRVRCGHRHYRAYRSWDFVY